MPWSSGMVVRYMRPRSVSWSLLTISTSTFAGPPVASASVTDPAGAGGRFGSGSGGHAAAARRAVGAPLADGAAGGGLFDIVDVLAGSGSSTR